MSRFIVGMLSGALGACLLSANCEPRERVPESSIMERYPAPGRLVEGDGRRLHLHCIGENAGPTVVIETGAAASSVLYWHVQNRIAEFAHVCTYDRAGLGWSDPAPAGRTMQDRADELWMLLARAKVRPPYVLVGHSMGGLLVRLFAREHPDMVAAMVLVDASEEEFSFSSGGNAQTAAQLGMLAAAAMKLAPADAQELIASRLPLPANAPAAAAIMHRPSVLLASKDDLDSFALLPPLMRGAGGFGSLGDLPLTVIRRGKMSTPPTSRDLAWQESQRRLLKLSTASKELVATDSGHNIHLDQPEVIAEAVRSVYGAER